MPATLEHPAATVGAGKSNLRKLCGVIVVGATVLAIVVGWLDPSAFFRAYLFAALACLQPALGCLLLTFIHRMTGGAWGRTLAPALAAGRRTVPWTLLFCVPLFYAGSSISSPGPRRTLDEHARALLAKHATYFAPWAFLLRAVVYAGAAWASSVCREGAGGPVDRSGRHDPLRRHGLPAERGLGRLAGARLVLDRFPGDLHGQPGPRGAGALHRGDDPRGAFQAEREADVPPCGRISATCCSAR